ncbi:Ig-like domain-containing protein, partial [Aeromonas sp. 43P]|uniref:Ig-like domain-containing protein n=1 Tax=Aeromonas sp. 43P TaxID=3115854 RepID=UPI002E7B73B5
TIENTVTISNIVVQLSPDSDSGEFGDMVTNNASPTLNGQSTPGAIVRVLFNNIYYDITPDAAGVWQFIPPGPLTDGEHTFTVIEE